VRTLKPSSEQSVDDEDPDGDYVVDIKDRIAYLTEAGVEKVERRWGSTSFSTPTTPR
jgi:preprotein translocase subunit SecA